MKKLLLFVLIAALSASCGDDDDEFNYNEPYLGFGKTQSEVISILGTPTQMQPSEAGDMLLYKRSGDVLGDIYIFNNEGKMYAASTITKAESLADFKEYFDSKYKYYAAESDPSAQRYAYMDTDSESTATMGIQLSNDEDLPEYRIIMYFSFRYAPQQTITPNQRNIKIQSAIKSLKVK